MLDKIGHRGVAGIVTENSLEGFKKSIELGFEFVELDVQLTSDQVPVVLHDKTLNRTTNSVGFLKDFSFNDLKSNVRLDNGEQIPTLVQVLKLFLETKIKLYIELINPEETKLVHKIATQFISKQQIIFSSFHHDCLLSIKELDQDQQTMALFECSPVEPLTLIQNCQADEAGIGIESISHRVVNLLQKNNIKVLVWTVRDRYSFKIAQDMAVDGIFTDFIDY